MDNIKDRLARVGELAGSGDALERDLALQILREIYSELKFGVREVAEEPVPAGTAADLTTQNEPAPEEFPSCGGVAAGTADGVVSAEKEPEPEPEPEPLPEPEPEPLPEPEPEPAPEKEELPAVRHRRVAPEVIARLYGDAPAEKLGDVMNAGRQTLGETLGGNKKDMAAKLAAAGQRDLKSAIGINDKFLMVRDMFDGDGKAFNEAIAYLDTFADLDEAIIYIHDTYNWSADSEGVKLLVELLERKLG